MKIAQRYVFKEVVRTMLLASGALCALFLVVDFFDRIDNILEEKASIGIVIKYFLFKIPQFLSLTLPLGMLVGIMLGVGLMSKNSEITAMRASGMKVFWIAKPIFILAFCLSLLDLAISETVVPYCSRRVREIYNIDIKEKHKNGTYSQNDFWWRAGDKFYSIGLFDSRNDTLHHPLILEVGDDFLPLKRTTAEKAVFVRKGLGWTMFNTEELNFNGQDVVSINNKKTIALPLKEEPKDFYDVDMDPYTMSYSQLSKFIQKQVDNGLAANGYLTDLYSKLAFPFVILVFSLVVLPFSLKPGRSGNMALSFVIGLLISFTYYAVHSFSLAMGRAEIWPPLFAAWIANFLMLLVGIILNIGAESPE